MSNRIELSSFFTDLLNKSQQVAAYIGVEHTLKNSQRMPLLAIATRKQVPNLRRSKNYVVLIYFAAINL